MKKVTLINRIFINVKIKVLTLIFMLAVFNAPAQKIALTDGASFTPATLVQIHLNSNYGSILQLTNNTSTNDATHGLIFKTLNTPGVFNIQINNQDSGYISFATNSHERMRIHGDGKISIGYPVYYPYANVAVRGRLYIGDTLIPPPYDILNAVYKVNKGVISNESYSQAVVNACYPATHVSSIVHGSISLVELNNNNNYSSAEGFCTGVNYYGDSSVNELTGINSVIQNMTNGTISKAYGFYSVLHNQISGSIVSNYHGFFVMADGYGTCTRLSGLTIPNLHWNATNSTDILLGTRFIPTGDFSVYDTSWKPSFFNGKIGIGTTNPQNMLHIVAAANPIRLEGLQSSSGNDLLVVDGSGVVTKRSINLANYWAIAGNSGTTPATNFVGTTDNQDLAFKVNNTEKMRLSSTGLGIGTTSPNSALQVNGSVSLPIKTLTSSSPYLAGANDYTILCSVASTEVDLPAASSCGGRIYIIKNISPASVTVVPYGSEKIDGMTSGSWTLSLQWQGISIQSDGSKWFIISIF